MLLQARKCFAFTRMLCQNLGAISPPYLLPWSPVCPTWVFYWQGTEILKSDSSNTGPPTMCLLSCGAWLRVSTLPEAKLHSVWPPFPHEGGPWSWTHFCPVPLCDCSLWAPALLSSEPGLWCQPSWSQQCRSDWDSLLRIGVTSSLGRNCCPTILSSLQVLLSTSPDLFHKQLPWRKTGLHDIRLWVHSREWHSQCWLMITEGHFSPNQLISAGGTSLSQRSTGKAVKSFPKRKPL